MKEVNGVAEKLVIVAMTVLLKVVYRFSKITIFPEFDYFTVTMQDNALILRRYMVKYLGHFLEGKGHVACNFHSFVIMITYI